MVIPYIAPRAVACRPQDITVAQHFPVEDEVATEIPTQIFIDMEYCT